MGKGKSKLVKQSKERIPRKLKKQIPQGVYCYTFTGKTSVRIIDGQERTAYHTKVCPFYQHIQIKNKKAQDEIDKEYPNKWVSRCKLTGIEDDICLNDQCKVCGVKDGFK